MGGAAAEDMVLQLAATMLTVAFGLRGKNLVWDFKTMQSCLGVGVLVLPSLRRCSGQAARMFFGLGAS